MATKKIRLLLAALLSLSGVLPAAATDYEEADYLPLAVGNSWTYGHIYHDSGLDALGDLIALYPTYLWSPRNESHLHKFTITVRGTEVIDGKTYYVLSDMPDKWPPAPPHLIAGKKLRWEGTHLMERTADGERSVFRFDGANDAGYTISTTGLDNLDYADGSILKGGAFYHDLIPYRHDSTGRGTSFTLTYGGENLVKAAVYSDPVGFYQFYFHGTEPGNRSCAFVENYGCIGCGWGIAWDDQLLFTNHVTLLQAVFKRDYPEMNCPTLATTATAGYDNGGHHFSSLGLGEPHPIHRGIGA